MALYLAEVPLSADGAAALTDTLNALAQSAKAQGGQLIEAQVGNEAKRAFVVLETETEAQATQAIQEAKLQAGGVKEVQLVGQELDQIKERAAEANYLVEWNLPAGLTLEKYLARKKEKSPLYANVPEVTFERTYVCKDMSKCLCLYDGPDEDAIRRARKAVDTPIDNVTTIKKIG